MNRETISQLDKDIATFKNDFERSMLILSEYSKILLRFNIDCDEAIHNNNIDSLHNKLAPDNRLEILRVIKSNKTILKSIKDLLEEKFQEWLSIEEEHKKFTEIYRKKIEMNTMQTININPETLIIGPINAGGNVIVGDNNNTNSPK